MADFFEISSMTETFRSLNNPIWQALHSGDRHLAIGNDFFIMYPEDIGLFVGVDESRSSVPEQLFKALPAKSVKVLIIKKKLTFSPEWQILHAGPLWQMVAENPAEIAGNEEIIPLGLEHIPEMLALTKLTQPGPFFERTIELGNYQGIFQGGKLVAMGGERFHPDHFAEISAICTHPDFRGRGFGSRLMSFLAHDIRQKGKIPFLHVRPENISAIDLYLKLGFVTRTEMNLTVIQKP